jgi:histidine triad (HIT) family protein
MEDCIFCSIISRKLPGHIIFENEWVCCFLDKYPINRGHTLVVPKKHYQEFRDVDEKSLEEIIKAAQKVTRVLEKLLKTDGTTIMQNNGMVKDVEHYHMHIIPRYKNDGFSWIEPNITIKEDEFIRLKEKLTKLLT